jgi:putative Tad-like protein involved in Flp pilus assembly
MKSRLSRAKSKGQVLVLVTIAMVALLGMLAVCTDVAVLYHNWSQLRKEADAAALAAASYLPDNPAKATTTAQNWVGVPPNGEPGDTLIGGTPTIGSLGYNGMADSSITVELQRTVPFYFARVLGFTNTPVRVLATAGVAPAGGASGWIPIGLPCTGPSCYGGCTPGTAGCYACGSVVTVKPGGGGQYTPGNYGLLSCTAIGSGGAAVRQGIADGCPGFLQVSSSGGVSALNKTGSTVGPTVQGIQDRIGGNTCPTTPPANVCSPGSSVDPNNPCVVLMPFVNFNTNGSGMLPVYGFGLGWILSANGQGNVTIEFISGVPSASTTPNPNAPNNGPFAAYLVQ